MLIGDDVQPEVRRHFLEVEPADAADALCSGRNAGVDSAKSSFVQRLHWPALSRILLALNLDHRRVRLRGRDGRESRCRPAAAS